MALDGVQRSGGTPKTVEQLLHSDNPTAWNAASGLGRIHDPEEDHFHHGKKLSVIARVKEKAKRWRQSLIKKRFGHEANHTPSWGVSLEDYEVEEDPDHHATTTHQSHLQQAPKSFRDNARHYLASDSTEKPVSFRKNTAGPALTKSQSGHHQGLSAAVPRVTIDESSRAKSFHHNLRENHPSQKEIITEALIVRENTDKQKQKLPCSEITSETEPSGSSNVTHKVQHSSDRKVTIDDETDKRSSGYADSDGENFFESPERADQDGELPPLSTNKAHQGSDRTSTCPQKSDEETGETLEAEGGRDDIVMEEPERKPATRIKTITEAVSEKLAPAYATVSEATSRITSKIQGLSIASLQGSADERKWDKGVSVTEYFKNKLEPGEDERALSQVISEVISPKRSPTEKGVVEKMKTAVTLLLQSDEPSASSSMKTSESSARIPVSTNAHEVEEENQGRILQAN